MPTASQITLLSANMVLIVYLAAPTDLQNSSQIASEEVEANVGTRQAAPSRRNSPKHQFAFLKLNLMQMVTTLRR